MKTYLQQQVTQSVDMQQLLSNVLGSKATSILGLLTGSPGIGMLVNHFTHGSPVDWNVVIPSLSTMFIGLFASEKASK